MSENLMTDKEYLDLMQDIMQEQDEEYRRIDENNKKILQRVSELKPKEWVDELLEWCKPEHWGICFDCLIELNYNKPSGKYYEYYMAELMHIQHVWVDQWCAGEDLYSGNIYIEVTEDLYLILPYSD